MVGTIAHVLHIPFFDALQLPQSKLVILYNEAERQRVLDKLDIEDVESALKIHGPYTEGFYDNELARLKAKVNG